MIKKYTRNKKYFTKNKKQLYRLVSLNSMLFGNNSGQINKETILLSVIFQKYYEELIFDVVNMANHNIVLEISWLKKHNSQINQKREILTMEYKCILDSESRY